MRYRGCGFSSDRRSTAIRFGFTFLGYLFALWLALPSGASAQNVSPADFALDALPATSAPSSLPEAAPLPAPLVTSADHPAKQPPARDLTIEGLVSYGHYHIFASGEDCKMYDIGIEYDRHTWGHLLGSRVDWVAEIMPMVLLHQPTEMDIWGNPLTTTFKTVPGVEIAPIGVRWLWRDGKAIKPYLMAKGGILVFAQKPLSNRTTYENLSLQSSIGLQVRINERFDLRLGLFGDYHFSDAFIVPVNPGLDVMNASMGLTYHIGSRRRVAAH